MQTQIISKKTLNNTITSESNIIKIVEDSVVMIDVAPEDVQELIVNENQVIIKLNNGETITLDNFNYETSDLVFRNQNGEMYVLDFKNVEYNPLENIEALLEGGAGTGATILNNWLAGGALALGAVGVGVAVFDAANGSSDTKQPSKDLSKLVDAINDAKNSLNQLDGDEKQRVENAINDAEAVLKDPESSQELLDQTADDLISIVEDALKDQEAKDAAKLEEAINNLEADLENAKDKLENEDLNDPYTDETKSELEKEIEEAQKLVDDFNNNIGDKPSIDDVNNARDELNNAVDNLKTESQQEFENTPATEADLVALETKANELQKKLDDNAELEESARYTDETRDALQQEINEALQLVADGRDPAKTVTKGDVIKATDELDAADAALKTNAQQEFEDSLATEADLAALETKAKDLQTKLNDNAKLEESARYTDETRDALQKEINEALQLVADGRDPSKNVTKEEVKKASDELDAADAALKTNAQQEFEDSLATEAELTALETKAKDLQTKLNDNAKLEESARYTDETRDALQKEINEALQLVTDGRDPSKNVTKEEVKKASDELDAADAALKTNAQQEFEDSLATEADLTALETKAKDLQTKLDDNAELEESARYTDETRDALQQEINEALQLVADGRDPAKTVTKGDVIKATDELDAADAALKTNAQQEFEDSLATEADLVALETKAKDLQTKLNDNAKLEESARYTDETRDALQKEINEALQLVADGRDPSKNVTKEEVKKASDELDAADAALKTNAQQEFEDSLATEAELTALETKAKDLQTKLNDNAKLEESARYTDETRDALQKEINEALQLVTDGRDPSKNVTKEEVKKASDELDAADAALKTNAQQEFEDSLATEADLVALETKANELQKKLDDNAELEESARYTDETRDALQQEINEALQLVADGRDPAKTVTKGDVIKATDELDAADAALKTNAQQEFEDSLATEADLAALETKAKDLQTKLNDNAKLEESARYTDETRDALQKEINEALQLVADGRDPSKNVTKEEVKKASDELDAADAALKTNAQQEFEDSLATEAELTALETKAKDLQTKLNDNAKLEESARYTDETRDALQKEINEALQLVTDGRDPSKNVTKEEVKKASDELDAADAALKTNAQQEFEDSLATEADLTALETKAKDLQTKLDDNAELEESARYTDETRDALQQEINEALQLVADGRDPAKTVTKGDVIKATDELDAADAALKTNAQQEFEDSLATEADLVALETKAKDLQTKLNDNAKLEESARYTDETRDALQKEINEALQLVADGRDPSKNVTKEEVKKASDELDAADAALKTNAQQEFEDSLATEAELTALETKAKDLQTKLNDNAKLEESARYTDETRDALQKEINEALQLVTDGRDPSKNVTKEEVKKASDELDAADAALKTNAQQEFEDSLATEADLTALETKAKDLQTKLDDNAELEESARYTDETRDALQQEINEALQLVADGRDPAKTVTKGDVIKATDELDAADAALKTNAQQEFENSLATEADLVALETKAKDLQTKLNDNAELEESARYTDETRDALQQEINEALQLVADGRDPSKNVTKEEVKKASDELDAADAGLKTNAQQEFEDSLATEADLVALETKANELQNKLDDNAELEESARYTDETRDALQQEINEALQLVADGRDPSKNVTKEEVKKATDELDATDAALKTNAQQEAAENEKLLAESIEDLEKLVEQAENKVVQNETARDKYTENSLSELTKEIADAKAVISQYKDPNQPNPSLEGSVLPAQKELQSAIDGLVTVVEILAVDNDVNIVATVDPSVISFIELVEGQPVLKTDVVQLFEDTGFDGNSATGFGVAKVGIGGAADVSALDFDQYLSFNIKENNTADISLKAVSGGISLGNKFNLIVLKEVAPDVWEVDQLYTDWLEVVAFGGSKTGSITLDEGNYRVLIQSNSGVAIASGNRLEVQELKINDGNNPTNLSGSISGNILSDVNQVEGQSGHDMYYLNTQIAVKPQDSTSQFVEVGLNGTKEYAGQYGTLTVKFDGSYTYVIDSSKKPSIGAVETFIYQIKDPETGKTSEAKLNITINNKDVDYTVIDENFIVDLVPTELPIPEGEVLSKIDQVIVASVGLGGVASVNVANFEDAIEINVSEGNLREVSFKAAGGAPIGLGAIPVSLEIYRLNEDTGLWELYSNTPDWFTIVGAVVAYGESQQNVDVVLEPGQYKAITTGSTVGIAVLPTITLTPVSDKIISYETVVEGQKINGDVTTENLDDFIVIKVNGFNTSQDSEVQGKFGKLTVNPDGTYVYTLNKDVKVSQLDVETFSIHLKNPNTGELATTTLNIRLDSFLSNDDINDVINVEAEIAERTYSENLGATSGSSVSKAFKVEGIKSGDVVYYEKDLTADVTFTVGTTLAINGDGRKMTYIVKDKAGNPVASGDVEVSKTTTNTIKVNNLPAGSYTLELNVTGSSYFSGSVKMEQVITEYLPTDSQSLEPVTGNIFDNDLGSDSVTSIQVQNQTAYTKFGNDKIKIQGEHGVLEIDHTGNYTYTPSKNSFGEDKFTYVTTSVNGSQDTAELVFGYTQTINGDENANVVSSGGLNDTFNLVSGADKLIFNLLDEADATGGNGFDTWSDFEAGVDVIDVSQLFVDANTSTTFSTDSTDQVADILSKYITVKDSVISIDRDGEGTQFEATQLLNIGPQNADLTLEQLLQNGQIIY